MSQSISSAEHLEHEFANPSRGVLGLVDELLAVAQNQQLSLFWRSDRCYFRLGADPRATWVELTTSKSVLRAVLARIAVLCNERSKDSVSPYGGTGEIQNQSRMVGLLSVSFVNSAEEQSLDILPPRPTTVTERKGVPAQVL